MPIRVSCKCGKTLNVQDAMAGKAIKCPGCGNPIRVPAAAAAKPQPTPAVDPTINQMFDEEGFSAQVAAVCPSCRAEMAANAVLCTKCGYHKESGEQLEGHKTAGVDIDLGELALMKARDDLAAGERIQQEMLSKAGLPWWGLVLVLFMMASAVSLAVITINAASREEGKEVDFDPIAAFMMLTGTGFCLVGSGATVKLLVHTIKKNAQKGQIIKLAIGLIVAFGVGIGLFIAASNR